MKNKKEAILFIVGALLSVALIVSIVALVVSNVNQGGGKNHEIAWAVDVVPTYDTEGVVSGKCLKCKKKHQEKIPALGSSEYNIEIVSEQKSCTVEREAEFTITVLENEVKFVTVLKPENHMLNGAEYIDDGKIFTIDQNNPPQGIIIFAEKTLSCDENGTNDGCFVCEKCKCYITVKVRKEHEPKYDAIDDVLAEFPDCTSAGTASFVCKYCEKTVSLKVPSRGHDYEEPEITDNENGTYTFTLKCKRCGFTETKTANNYSVENVEPDCVKNGKTTYTFALTGGGELEIKILIPTLGHRDLVYGTMDTQKVYNIAAYPRLKPIDEKANIECGRSYSASFECENCDKSVIVRVKKYHKVPEGVEWKVNGGVKYREYKCEDCKQNVRDEVDENEVHDYVYSVNKTAVGYDVVAVCDYCGDEKIYKSVTLSENIIAQPTCMSEGLKVYRFTVGGEEHFANAAIEKKPHMHDGEPIDKNKVYFESDDDIQIIETVDDTLTGVIVCSECENLITVKVAHVPPTDESLITIVEPTEDTDGSKTYECTKCKKIITEVIPKKQKEN